MPYLKIGIPLDEIGHDKSKHDCYLGCYGTTPTADIRDNFVFASLFLMRVYFCKTNLLPNECRRDGDDTYALHC